MLAQVMDRRFSGGGRRWHLRLQAGQLRRQAALVLFDVALGVAWPPAAGHYEDERDEDDLTADAHPPPVLPLVRRGLGRRLDGGAVRAQVGQVGLGHIAQGGELLDGGGRRHALLGGDIAEGLADGGAVGRVSGQRRQRRRVDGRRRGQL